MRATQKNICHQQKMFSHIEQWQQSDLSQKEYCAQNQVKPWVFYYWLRKYRKQRNTTEGFFPIQPVSIQGDIRIHYPSGVEVHLPPQTGLHTLKSLISINLR